jgi:type IV pilus assembly protein PilN
LIEIHSVAVGQGKDAKRVADFAIDVAIKRPREKEKEQQARAGSNTPAPAGNAASKKP